MGVEAGGLDIIPIPAFADNYIWALIREGRCAVVDPGDAVPVIAFLEARGLTLTAILITHHHADHTGGVDALTARWAVPVYGPAAEHITCVTQPLAEGDTVSLPTLIEAPFNIMEVPGHTRGHIAYLSGDVLFCGDTLFAAGCGRIFEGTAAQLHRSLSRLAALPDATRVYCTHEYTLSNLRFALAADADNPALLTRSFDAQEQRKRGEPTLPSTIGLERATNPFLRCNTDPVARSARSSARLANLDVVGESSEVEVFALLRQWKDSFRA